MKADSRGTKAKGAFTLVEILTVMSIIVILITLLVPSLTMVRRYASEVKQRAQFHSIDVALEQFSSEQQGYPPSGRLDEDGSNKQAYCGAMKLCEAMMGQDLLGFNPNSRFRSDGTDGATTNPTQFYPPDPLVDTSPVDADGYRKNLQTRRGPYLQLENANAYRLKNLYRAGISPFVTTSKNYVLCDVYNRVTLAPDANATGAKSKCGMPILYYKADTSKNGHNTDKLPPDVLASDDIYDYRDNDDLVVLPLPWNTTAIHHPMASSGTTPGGGTADATIFYKKTKNPKITTTARPYRADSYILLSAGFDGQYGTDDDIFNFER